MESQVITSTSYSNRGDTVGSKNALICHTPSLHVWNLSKALVVVWVWWRTLIRPGTFASVFSILLCQIIDTVKLLYLWSDEVAR